MSQDSGRSTGRSLAGIVAAPAARLLAVLMVSALLLGAAALHGAAAQTGAAAAAAAAPAPERDCGPVSSSPQGADFRRTRPYEFCNFAGRDLRRANFDGVVLKGVSFIHARLQGASFRNARFLSGGSPFAAPVDFTAANLDGASFAQAQFESATYFTAANLSGAEFSGIDFTAARAVFGDQTLRLDDPKRRPSFRGAILNCEFIGQWNRVDLSGADLSACFGLLVTPATPGAPGHDFRQAVMNGVSFEGLDLRRSRWDGAQLRGARFAGAVLDDATGLGSTSDAASDLSGAVFTRASLKNVDLSHGKLNGANFTDAELSQANLSGASLGKADGIDAAARFDGAHMKNVNLSSADLTGATLRYASFYGTDGRVGSAWTCQTDVQRCTGAATGATCGCASAAGATLTGTAFTGAYLFGVDFGGSATTLNGTDFSGAMLAGASFRGASFTIEADPGRAPDFSGALLQGADLSGTDLRGVSFDDAAVDFGFNDDAAGLQLGNTMSVALTGLHTKFAGWTGSTAPCVQVSFAEATAFPMLGAGDAARTRTDGSNTCADGSSYVDGCGAPRPGPRSRANPRWNGDGSLRYWFQYDGTYQPAASPAAVCDGKPPEGSRW